MAKYLKRFELQSDYQAYKESENWIIPNVSTIEELEKTVYAARFNPVPDVPDVPPVVPEPDPIVYATFNPMGENMMALYDTSNIKSLKVDGQIIDFEPPVKNSRIVTIESENIQINDDGTGVCPVEYCHDFRQGSNILSWSLKLNKPLDSNLTNCLYYAITDTNGNMTGMVLSIKQCLNMDILNYNAANDSYYLTSAVLSSINSMVQEDGIELMPMFLIGSSDDGNIFSYNITSEIITATPSTLPKSYNFDTEGSHQMEIELCESTIMGPMFSQCCITSVIIPETVKIIDATFGSCWLLKDIKLPNSLEMIGAGALGDCRGISEIIIPDNVTSINFGAFDNCMIISSMILPSNIKYIGPGAFANCGLLNNIYSYVLIPPSNTPLNVVSLDDWNAFVSNAEGRKIYVPAESVEAYKSAPGWSEYADSIMRMQGNNEIWYTSADETVVEPHDGRLATDDFDPNPLVVFGANIVSNTYENGVGIIEFDADITSIGYAAFAGCQFTSVTLPESVTTIGDGVFTFCAAETINIPNTITSIGGGAFALCCIKQINIPEGVNVIKTQTFASSDLCSVVIPSTVSSVEDRAFNGAGYLSSIVCKAKTAPVLGSDVFGSVSETGTLYYPQGSNYSSWVAALPSTWTVVEI